MTDKTTYTRILESGKQEFLKKGFRDASLRTIVKNAGVTTGAFYGYFKGKRELFEALVDEPVMYLKDRYEEHQKTFDESNPNDKTSAMEDYTTDHMMWYIKYIYEHFDAFKLIINDCEGSGYENYIDQLMEIEYKYTMRFFESMKDVGKPVQEADTKLMNSMNYAFFHALFEIVRRDMTQEEAEVYTRDLSRFFYAGWKEIMGL